MPTPKWKEENWIFWECGTCTSSSGRTGIRANTVLEKLNLKLERFVMLLWNFAERGKMYEQISTVIPFNIYLSHFVQSGGTWVNFNFREPQTLNS